MSAIGPYGMTGEMGFPYDNDNDNGNGAEVLPSEQGILQQHPGVWDALLHASVGRTQMARELLQNLDAAQELPTKFQMTLHTIICDRLRTDPEALTNLGVLEGIGIRSHNRHLSAVSTAASQREIAMAHEHLQRLSGHNRDELLPEDQFYYDQIISQLYHIIQGAEFIHHRYVTDQLDGVQESVLHLFTTLAPLNCEEDVDNYIARLAEIPLVFDQAIQRAREAAAKGIVMPNFTLQLVENGLVEILNAPMGENPFYSRLAKLVENDDGPQPVGGQLAAAREIIIDKVLPAYEQLRQCVAELAEQADDTAGVHKLPNGLAYYDYCLRDQTTTEYTADEIHQLGIAEVARITERMLEILTAEGHGDGSLKERMDALKQDESHFYPNSAEGKADLIAHFGEIIERTRSELGHLFRAKPEAGVEVKPVPASQQGSAPGAYYFEPSIDGSRPGTFYVNLRDTHELPKYGMETLAVHEAEPGHHFQLTLQMQGQLPLIFKTNMYNAYLEGWALYAEKLAYEEGFYSTPLDELGHLQDEMLRAVRLVVDTGIHAKHWSRQQAIDYMVEKTGYDVATVETEVDRYCVLPGQACSYKVGQLKILELRDYAKAQLGDRFSYPDFHDIVLLSGAIPLTLLEQRVKEYVAKTLDSD